MTTRPTASSDVRRRLGQAVAPVVVGADEVLDALAIALAVGGHVLLEGVPGVAKTLVAEATARALGARFRRAQFTPDMLPSDLTGTMTLRDGELAFRPGPVFTNVLLADEINRTPPKTQAALLEAMGEGHVTVDGTPRPLAEPFLVVATQNPIEYEGTYPLPEAQLDRFLMKVDVGYPDEADEAALLGLARRGLAPVALDEVRPIVTPDAAGETAGAVAELVAGLRAEVDATAVTDEVAGYLLAIVRRTRDLPSVEVGASPRAGVHLLAVGQGRGPPGRPLVRDPRRRGGRGPAGAPPPPGAAGRGRAGPLPPRRRGGRRHRRRPRPEVGGGPDLAPRGWTTSAGTGRSRRTVSPSPRTVALAVVLALALLVVPWPLVLLAAVALAGAVVVDAVAARRPLQVTRTLPPGWRGACRPG